MFKSSLVLCQLIDLEFYNEDGVIQILPHFEAFRSTMRKLENCLTYDRQLVIDVEDLSVKIIESMKFIGKFIGGDRVPSEQQFRQMLAEINIGGQQHLPGPFESSHCNFIPHAYVQL